MDTRTQLRELSLFTGAGGGLLATQHLLGFQTVCYVEIDTYCQQVLQARIRDGLLDDAPIWDDVRTFDGRPWRGCVDIVAGGDPCQANSNASLSPSRYESLANHLLRIVDEVRPYFVMRENPAQTRKDAPWPADRFVQALEYLGYTAAPVTVRACCMGSDHKRARLFVLGVAADADCEPNIQAAAEIVAERTSNREAAIMLDCISRRTQSSPAWLLPPASVCRGLNDVASRVDRLRALGNGQVPAVVALAWEVLTARSAELAGKGGK
jgi:DNA (cytosine-5)-methyltransferase 1